MPAKTHLHPALKDIDNGRSKPGSMHAIQQTLNSIEIMERKLNKRQIDNTRWKFNVLIIHRTATKLFNNVNNNGCSE